jgi:hypothetical protein
MNRTLIAAILCGALLIAAQSSQVCAQPKTNDTTTDSSAPAIANASAAVEDGFVSIFDGKTFDGWDGDPVYWRVEDGCIVGEITPETIVKRNTFIIWRGGAPADFELKLDYRITPGGNSGVNYRSVELTDAKWSLAGYQSDIDGPRLDDRPLRHTGQSYEERGRTFLARRGEIARVGATGKPTIIGAVGDIDELKAFINDDGWNHVHLIARGNVLVHMLNGHAMSIVIDDDTAHRTMEGLIGVQVHVGPPMKVEYRNILLKQM